MKNLKAFLYVVLFIFSSTVFSVDDRSLRRVKAYEIFVDSVPYIKRRFERGKTDLRSRQRILKKVRRRNRHVRFSSRSFAALLMNAKYRYWRGEPLIK